MRVGVMVASGSVGVSVALSFMVGMSGIGVSVSVGTMSRPLIWLRRRQACIASTVNTPNVIADGQMAGVYA